MSYPFTLKLKHPYQFGSKTISEVHYRRPKAKDIKKIKPDKLETGDLIDLFASISDRMPAEIDEMDMEDTLQAIQLVSGFLANGQESGE